MTAPTDVSLGLVEDSNEDFDAFSRVVSRDAAGVHLHRWRHAEEVLRDLSEPGALRDAWPSILVIDLNLPGIDGAELVRRLRTVPATSTMPLFVLSGSDRQVDIDRCYAAGANAYLTKPTSAAELRALLQMVFASLAVYKTPTPPADAAAGDWDAIESNREAYERQLAEERRGRDHAEALQQLTSRLATRITRTEIVKSLTDQLKTIDSVTRASVLEATDATPPSRPDFLPAAGGTLARLPIQTPGRGPRRTLEIVTSTPLDEPGQAFLEQVAKVVADALDRVARLGTQRRRTQAVADLPNERWWTATINQEIRQAAEQHDPLSIVLIELIDFAQFLQSNGHVAGDQRLLTVAEAWRREGFDLLSPYGDEQFVALMPGKSEAQAAAIAEGIRRAPGMMGLFAVGTAQWHHGDSDQQLMGRAETALQNRRLNG